MKKRESTIWIYVFALVLLIIILMIFTSKTIDLSPKEETNFYESYTKNFDFSNIESQGEQDKVEQLKKLLLSVADQQSFEEAT